MYVCVYLHWCESAADHLALSSFFLLYVQLAVLLTVAVGVPCSMLLEALLTSICFRTPDFHRWILPLTAANSVVVASEYPSDYSSCSDGDHNGVVDANASIGSTSHPLPDTSDSIGLAYLTLQSSESEADELMSRARLYLDRYLSHADKPWRSSEDRKGAVAVAAADRHLYVKAIEALLGMYPNGAAVPLSVWDALRYQTPSGKLQYRIEQTRRDAVDVVRRVEGFDPSSPSSCRDIVLLQSFILEHFSLMKRFILSQHMNTFLTSASTPVSPSAWIAAWASVLAASAFFLYWTLRWALTQGGSTYYSWMVTIGVLLLQDICVVQVAKVYLLYVACTASIQPQLKHIQRVLRKVAVECVQNKASPSTHDLQQMMMIGRSLSPACRASYLSATRDLTAAAILRQISAVDMQMCRNHHHRALPILASVAVIVPAVLSMYSFPLGFALLEVLLATTVSGVLLAQYHLVSTWGLLTIIPVLGVCVFLVWRSLQGKRRFERGTYFYPHDPMIAAGYSEQHPGLVLKDGANETETTTAAVAGGLGSSYLWDGFMYCTYYVPRPWELIAVLWKRAESRRHPILSDDSGWVVYNKPYFILQGSRSRSRASGQQTQGDRLEFADSLSNDCSIDLERIPTEIRLLVNKVDVSSSSSSLQGSGHHDGDGNEEKKEEEMKTMGEHSLNGTSSYSALKKDGHVFSIAEQTNNSPYSNESIVRKEASSLAIKFREAHTIYYTASEAAEEILLECKRQVTRGRLLLIDLRSREKLFALSSVHECDLPINIQHVRGLLLHVWSRCHPDQQPLHVDEAIEVVDYTYTRCLNFVDVLSSR